MGTKLGKRREDHLLLSSDFANTRQIKANRRESVLAKEQQSVGERAARIGSCVRCKVPARAFADSVAVVLRMALTGGACWRRPRPPSD